jgi:hypothetical protein
MDTNPHAARRFYQAVRTLAETASRWSSGIIPYETTPDEQFDLSLVSERVYGRRDEYLAVMAAAGLDTMDQPMTQRLLLLPTEANLAAVKRRTGFESRSDSRYKKSPTWS